MGKHIPQRMCVYCREMRPKHELLRFAARDGKILVDNGNALMGRGAYICKNIDCIKKAQKKKSLSRHFKCAVPEDIYLVAEQLILTER